MDRPVQHKVRRKLGVPSMKLDTNTPSASTIERRRRAQVGELFKTLEELLPPSLRPRNGGRSQLLVEVTQYISTLKKELETLDQLKVESVTSTGRISNTEIEQPKVESQSSWACIRDGAIWVHARGNGRESVITCNISKQKPGLLFDMLSTLQTQGLDVLHMMLSTTSENMLLSVHTKVEFRHDQFFHFNGSIDVSMMRQPTVKIFNQACLELQLQENIEKLSLRETLRMLHETITARSTSTSQ